MKIKILLIITLSAVLVSCGGDKQGDKRKLDVPSAKLISESDSLAYIIGMSMAQNLLKIDSLVDLDVVATAMSQYGKGSTIFTIADARTAYLKYKLHIEPERIRRYEDQLLRELSERDRSFVRSRSGIIYNITSYGQEGFSPRNGGDWVEVNYTISRMEGDEIIFSTADKDEPFRGGLSTLPEGLMECVKLLGRGGKMIAIIPSKFAYGSDGDETLGIEPFETLRYDIELSKLERNGASKRLKERERTTF